MSFATKMYLSIIAILVVVVLGVCLAWQHAKNVASEAGHKLELSEVKALTQKERETRLLEKLNNEHAEEIAELFFNPIFFAASFADLNLLIKFPFKSY